MTKPTKLIYDDAAHAYYVDGKRWPGMSNYGGQIENQSALINWGKRQAAKGVALDDQLRQEILLNLDDDSKLDRLAERALTVAGANASRDRGSEIHRITEQHDKGRLPVLTPDMQAIIATWEQVLADHGITIDADHVERIVVHPEFRCCGTFDRIAWYQGRRVVLDLKTGKPTRYRHSMCVQLALLASAPWITANGYTHGEKTTFTEFEPMPEVDQEIGLIVSMPADGSTPAIYELPLADGLRAARLAKEAKEWTSSEVGRIVSIPAATVVASDESDTWSRASTATGDAVTPSTAPITSTGSSAASSGSTDSADECAASTATQPPTSSPTPDGTTSTDATTPPPVDDAATRAWLSERLEQVKRHPAATARLKLNWLGAANLPAWSDCTAEHFKVVETNLDFIEAEFTLPFIPRPQPPRAELPPEPEPKQPPDEGRTMEPADIDALMRSVEQLPEPANTAMRQLAALVRAARCSVDPRMVPSERRFQIVRAMKAWALVNDEELLRAGLALVLGDDAVQPAFATGALLAGLTIQEATNLISVAGGLEEGGLVAAYDGDVCRLRRAA